MNIGRHVSLITLALLIFSTQNVLCQKTNGCEIDLKVVALNKTMDSCKTDLKVNLFVSKNKIRANQKKITYQIKDIPCKMTFDVKSNLESTLKLKVIKVNATLVRNEEEIISPTTTAEIPLNYIISKALTGDKIEITILEVMSIDSNGIIKKQSFEDGKILISLK